MQLQADTVTFENVAEGDELPVVTKTETQQTIDDYSRLALPPLPGDWRDLHSDEEFAQGGIFGGTVNLGVTTCAYLMEVLERAFPLTAIFNGGFMEMRATEPICAGDTVTFTGRVSGKRVHKGRKLVDVELAGANQLGQRVALARATVHL